VQWFGLLAASQLLGYAVAYAKRILRNGMCPFGSANVCVLLGGLVAGVVWLQLLWWQLSIAAAGIAPIVTLWLRCSDGFISIPLK
jgi:hypothetical protein